jgi:hypothetical protein
VTGKVYNLSAARRGASVVGFDVDRAENRRLEEIGPLLDTTENARRSYSQAMETSGREMVTRDYAPEG